jgi:hypothetical protein
MSLCSVSMSGQSLVVTNIYNDPIHTTLLLADLTNFSIAYLDNN